MADSLSQLEKENRILRRQLDRCKTNRGRMEEQRERNARLHRAVIAQMRETQTRLEQSELLAQEANAAKSQFLANMSHELRTPMNGVIGMAELMLTTTLTDHQHRLATQVVHSSRALLSIINDVLDFSKIEAGAIELEKVAYNPGSVLEEACLVVADRAHMKGLRLVSEVHESSIILGDPGRFRQIAINLLSNAVNFTDTGHVLARIQSTVVGDKCKIRLEVRDTGCGFPAEFAETLFEPFRQADQSTTRQFGGTGLGLSIVRELANEMNGQAGATSVEDGALVWCEIEGTHVGDAWTDQPLRGRTIALSIEDPLLQTSITPLLEKLGAQTISYEGPDAGIDAVVVQFDSDCSNRIPCSGVLPIPVVCITDISKHEESRPGVTVIPAPPRMTELTSGILSRPEITDDPDTSTPGGFNARILLAEDNPVNARVASQMLEFLGCSVTAVPNGQEAVTSFSDGDFDLVFMDCQMPVMDGYEAAAALRSQSRVPIVALTANALTSERDRCLAIGMDDFVTKPFTIKVLREVVQRWAPPLVQMVDRTVFEDLRQLDATGELCTRLARVFITEGRTLVTQIAAAPDRDSKRAAHSLKSSAAQIGAQSLSDAAAALEAKAGGPSDGEIQQLNTLFRATCSELTNIVGIEEHP